MARMGMDVDEVEKAARDLKARATDLGSLIARIDAEVRRLPGLWQGKDADMFVHDWWPGHKKHLVDVQGSINGLGQSAWNNAQEQRQVSSGGHSSGTVIDGRSSSGPTAGGPGAHPSDPVPSLVSNTGHSQGPEGTQHYSVDKAISDARSEIDSTRPTGYNAPGECIKSVQRWIQSAGGTFGGGGVVSGYVNSGAVQVSADQVRPGDVIQYTSLSTPESFDYGVHTVMVAGVNSDGSLDIIQSNSTFANGKTLPAGTVSEEASWIPKPPAGFEARYWRFASSGGA